MLHDRFNISFSFRLFVLYFVSVALLAMVFVNEAVKQAKQSNLQSAETLLIDYSQLMATTIEAEIGINQQLSVESFREIFEKTAQKRFEAQIYNLKKVQTDVNVYVTDARGIVIYDSQGHSLGEDFSAWNDVFLTLNGRYGARVSLAEPSIYSKIASKKLDAEDGAKEMVVAAPIVVADQIIGVVSAVHSTEKLNNLLLTGEQSLRNMVFVGIGLALFVMLMMSWWLTRTLKRLANYAKAMAAQQDLRENIRKPSFLDKRLADLTHSIENLREALDGKAYVEQYTHSLTHELKNPVAGIRAASEVLQSGDLSPKEQTQFINRIDSASARLSSLVDRMLQLAQLENQNEISNPKMLEMTQLVKDVVEEYRPILASRSLSMHLDICFLDAAQVSGDALLLRQALHNIIDNAIDFAMVDSEIKISLEKEHKQLKIHVYNRGELIPDYAESRLFERFFSLPRAADQPRSTGLGLSFVQQILMLHRGNIQIENVPNGVRATLSLPLTL